MSVKAKFKIEHVFSDILSFAKAKQFPNSEFLLILNFSFISVSTKSNKFHHNKAAN